MNPVVKNVLVFIGAVAVGMIVNMGIIILSPNLIPIPEGINPADPESLKAGMSIMKPINFLMPFLAHALGTLSGAWFAGKFAAAGNMKLAIGIGFFFLIGGIAAVIQLGAPMWFNATDLLLAYIPCAWIGGKLGIGSKNID